MWIISSIILLAGLVCALVSLAKQEELDELKEELDKREVALDERANRIAADDQTLTQEWQMLREAKEELDKSRRHENGE